MDAESKYLMIMELKTKYPDENIISDYLCALPHGYIFVTQNYIFQFLKGELQGKFQNTAISINQITSVELLEENTLSIKIITKPKTYFFHSVKYGRELYHIALGKLQTWYQEYNKYYLARFNVPPSESLVECVYCTVKSPTRFAIPTPGTLYVSQNYIVFEANGKTSTEKVHFQHTNLEEISLKKILLESYIKIVQKSDPKEEYWVLPLNPLKKTSQLHKILNNLFETSVSRKRDLDEDPYGTFTGALIYKDPFTSQHENTDKEILEKAISQLHNSTNKLLAIEQFFLTAEKSQRKNESQETSLLNDLKEVLISLTPYLEKIQIARGEGNEDSEAEKTVITSEIAPGRVMLSGAGLRNPHLKVFAGGVIMQIRVVSLCLDKIEPLLKELDSYYQKAQNQISLQNLQLSQLTTSLQLLAQPINPTLESLKKHFTNLKQITEVLKLSYDVANTPLEERESKFHIDTVRSKLQISSFWYHYTPELKLVEKVLQTAMASLAEGFHHNQPFWRYTHAVTASTLYAFSSARASKKMTSQDLITEDFARCLWNLGDTPVIRSLSKLTERKVSESRDYLIHSPDEKLSVKIRVISAGPLPFPLPNVNEIRVGETLARAISSSPSPSPKSQKKQDAPMFSLEDLPVILHIHGGGFIAMSPDSHEVYLREWAHMTQTLIISVNYAKAPEYRWPHALNQCFFIYQWILAGNLGFHPRSITLVGDSAGGNLVCNVTLKALMEGCRKPDSLVLIYPAVNLTKMLTPSRIMNVADPLISANFLLMCSKAYLPEDVNPMETPLISPLFADEKLLAQFPQTYIMAAGYDPLLDECVDFCRKLVELKVDVVYKLYSELPHGFLQTCKIFARSAQTVLDSGLWLQCCVAK